MTGKTNFFIAKILAWLIASACLMDVINFFHQVLVHKTPLSLCLLYTLAAVSFLRDAYKCDQSEEDVLSTTKAKRFVPVSYVFRIFLFICSVSLLPSSCMSVVRAPIPFLQFISEFYLIGLSLLMYFVEVDPLPPAKSKVKKFIESLLSFLKRKPIALES